MNSSQPDIGLAEKKFIKQGVSIFLIPLLTFLIFALLACAVCVLIPTYGIFIAIALIAVAICIACAIYLSRFKKLSSPIAALAARFSENPECTGDCEELLPYIEDATNTLCEKNANYARIINEKDSLLKGIFLQSRMRDIYVSLDDVEKQFNVPESYVMIYMRVHYKDKFFETGEDPSKSTFFLKQLIELYLQAEDNDCATFQVENDQIVSIIRVNSDNDSIMNVVSSVINKLENESDYVFFTTVVSKPHTDTASLKTNFDKLSRLSRYAMPVTETQVLVEDEIKQGAGHFYFTVEQMEKLSSLMQNGAREECIRNLNELLDYNVKKGVNGFDIYLLCTEIVNCAVKLLNRLFHTTPTTLNLNSVYAQLDRAVTAQQYQKICAEICSQVIDYISFNKRDEDYIISFILDYIENHYAEDIYLNLFAEKLKLTAAYISSYFKEKMNVNLTDYLNSFRIKKATVLIANPQYKNKDIADAVGLQNINTFIRLFKKYTGYTPGEYRKKHFNDSSL